MARSWGSGWRIMLDKEATGRVLIDLSDCNSLSDKELALLRHWDIDLVGCDYIIIVPFRVLRETDDGIMIRAPILRKALSTERRRWYKIRAMNTGVGIGVIYHA